MHIVANQNISSDNTLLNNKSITDFLTNFVFEEKSRFICN